MGWTTEEVNENMRRMARAYWSAVRKHKPLPSLMRPFLASMLAKVHKQIKETEYDYPDDLQDCCDTFLDEMREQHDCIDGYDWCNGNILDRPTKVDPQEFLNTCCGTRNTHCMTSAMTLKEKIDASGLTFEEFRDKLPPPNGCPPIN